VAVCFVFGGRCVFYVFLCVGLSWWGLGGVVGFGGRLWVWLGG